MKNCLYLAFALLTTLSFGQEKKQMNIERLKGEAPRIDGVLNDVCWKRASLAEGFSQYEPYNGSAPSQDTKVFLTYDDEALYVGAKMYDKAIDSLYTTLGKRDAGASLNADMFKILIGPFNDGINMVEFMVSASGVQSDSKHTGSKSDINWNAVWESEVGIQDDAWIVEYKIPYSALRLPKSDVQDWGFHLMRHIRRHREWDSWTFIDANIQGIVNQAGNLQGIENIKPPMRLSLMPYVSTYFVDVDGKGELEFNGGMDLKYGVNESFTLDMTLIPDFGQVKSDDEVNNLSPFEVKYNENRSFFTEGTELFNKGGIFYSRRVGSQPHNFYQTKEGEYFVRKPKETKMLNATKFSGRTKGGLGIGVFNAVTDNAMATVRDTSIVDGVKQDKEYEVEIQGVSNYNMLVLDQNLPNNSFVSLVNTNVNRFGNDYKANVSGTEFSLNDRKQAYNVSGKFILSQINTGNTSFGHSYYTKLAKTSGKWLFEYNHYVESDKYEINDFGFLRSNNEFSNSFYSTYRELEPKGIFRSYRMKFGLYHTALYKPREFSEFHINYDMSWTLKESHFSTGISSTYKPFKSHNFYEARTSGRDFIQNEMYRLSMWASSDYRKKLAIDFRLGTWDRIGSKEKAYWWFISPRIAPNDKFLFIYSLNFNKDCDNNRYVTKEYDNSGNVENVVFGQRDVKTVTNKIAASYIFNNKAALNFALRHYWQQVEYYDFFYLNEDGHLGNSLGYEKFGDSRNSDVNIFTIDFTYTGNFAPGSELTVVWKNAISNWDNELVHFSRNIRRTFDSPQTNSISVKALYYLDYQNMRKWFKS